MDADFLKIGSSVIHFTEVLLPFTRPNKTEIPNGQRSWKPTPVPMLVMAATFSQTTHLPRLRSQFKSHRILGAHTPIISKYSHVESINRGEEQNIPHEYWKFSD